MDLKAITWCLYDAESTYRLHNVIVGMFDGGTDVAGRQRNAKTNARSRSGSAITICLPSVQEP